VHCDVGVASNDDNPLFHLVFLAIVHPFGYTTFRSHKTSTNHLCVFLNHSISIINWVVMIQKFWVVMIQKVWVVTIQKVWVLPSMHREYPVWPWKENDYIMMVVLGVFFYTFTIQWYSVWKVSESISIAFVVPMIWVGWQMFHGIYNRNATCPTNLHRIWSLFIIVGNEFKNTCNCLFILCILCWYFEFRLWTVGE
jgi:hypothetical protein